MDKFVWFLWNCLGYVCTWLLWFAIPYSVRLVHLPIWLSSRHCSRFLRPSSPMCQCVMCNFAHQMAIDRIFRHIWLHVNTAECTTRFPYWWLHSGLFYKTHSQPHRHHCKRKNKIWTMAYGWKSFIWMDTCCTMPYRVAIWFHLIVLSSPNCYTSMAPISNVRQSNSGND